MALLTAAVLLFVPALGVPAAAPFSSMTFDEACTAARQQARPVLVYFSEPGNQQCESYHELTWSDEGVEQWLAEQVTAIEVAGDEQAPLRKRFDVRAVPTVLLMSPDGTVWARVVGFRDPPSLLKELATALEASDAVALARRRLEQNTDDVVALLGYAKALEEAGRFDDALEQYVRCFDQDKNRLAGFGGAQLVVIDELGRLAAQHSPARRALLQCRDESRKRILSGQGRRTDPAVLAAANTQLDDLDNTLAAYERMQKEWPGALTTRLLRECAVDSALKLKTYDRVAALIDVARRADRAHQRYLQDLRKPLPQGTDYEKFRDFEREAFIERTAKFYEMLIGMGNLDDVAQVASTLIKVDSGAECHDALARAALRTGRPTKANVEQARRAVELSDTPDAPILSTLVRILITLGSHDEAAEVVEQYGPRLADQQQRDALKRLLTSRD